jgi:PAS domain S-box-containing protein
MVNILVVDDEEDVIELLTILLKKGGYKVESTLSGQEALKKLKEIKVDLVLLDLMMPEMDGFEVCKEIIYDPVLKSIPIIVVTAKGDFDSIEKAYKYSPVRNYITKPFDNKTLLKTIKDVLRKETTPVPKKRPTKKLNDEIFREIIERFPDGIVLLDDKNTVLAVNISFEGMTGFSKKEVVGYGHLPELLKPLDDEGTLLLSSEVFRACFCNDPSSTSTFNIINKHGIKLKINSTIFKIKSKITVIVLSINTSAG